MKEIMIRRSIRTFDEANVETEKIDKLLRAASRHLQQLINSRGSLLLLPNQKT